MSIKVGGTIVIDDSRGLANISNLKTVGGTSLIGSGNIAVAGNFDTVTVISANTNATARTLYVATANLTLTLPGTPADGDCVAISNMSGYGNIIIGRNGNDIQNVAEDMTVDVVDAGFTLCYSGATNGWVII